MTPEERLELLLDLVAEELIKSVWVSDPTTEVLNAQKFINKEKVFECPAQKDLKIIDLTGAGDLFAAGYLHGIVNNFDIMKSLDQGTIMSTKVIQQIGARL